MKKNICLIGIILISIYLSGCNGQYFGPGMADFAYNLPGNCILYHAGETHIAKDHGTTTVIDSEVTGIAWDDNFILAEQLKNKNKNYWIIDVKAEKKYGPLTENDFKSKKKELKVNDKLKLAKPEKYKYLDKNLVQ